MVFEFGLLTLEHGMPYDVPQEIDVDDDEQEGTAFPGLCGGVDTSYSLSSSGALDWGRLRCSRRRRISTPRGTS